MGDHARMTTAEHPENDPILRTKLHRPRVSDDLVHRERLHALLDRGSRTSLTLVAAPAGYGKSMLVSHWAESLAIPSAWLSMDEHDGDSTTFVSYVVAAAQTVFPDALRDTAALIEAPTRPHLPVLARCLINELDAIDSEFVLVMDDYHSIPPTSEVHDLLGLILEHPPRFPRLVIVSRRDPPLPMASLRGGGTVTELGLQDLRFTPAETAELVQTSSGKTVGDEALTTLQRRTEGWAVALRLVMMELRHVADPEMFLAQLSGGARHTSDYLLQEVWARRSPQMQDWLVKSSILDRFCPALCEAVCAAGDARASSDLDGGRFVDALQRTNLFTVALDDRGEWFRHHHLFREMLEDQLKIRMSPDEIAALHSIASAWLAESGLFGEAIDHTLAAGDVFAAAQIIESRRVPAFNEDRWRPVEEWLARLPEEVVRQHTGLLLARAWVIYSKIHFAQIPEVLEELARCPDEIAEGEAGEIAFFESVILYFSGEADRCAERSERALVLIPKHNNRFRSEAEIFRGLGLQMGGQANRAIQLLDDPLAKGATRDPIRQSRLLACQTYIYLLSARSPGADAASARLAQISGMNVFVSCWAWTLRGLVFWWGDEIERALPLFRSVADHLHLFSTRAAIDAMVGLALSYSALDKDAEATEAMDQTLEFAVATGDPVDLMVARSGQARLALLQGDLESAKAWLVSAVHPTPDVSMLFWLEVPSVTRCRVLIAGGSPSALEQALEHLDEHLTVAKETKNTCRTIEALVLKSTALERSGRGEEALATLDKAVALAGPGTWFRPFAEAPNQVVGLLDRRTEANAASPVVEAIASVMQRARRAPTAEAEPRQHDASLIESLTNRQCDVLGLLARRLQNKEIAAELFISTQTVNSHLKSIYQKLGVGNRRQAVARAVELGILRPPS